MNKVIRQNWEILLSVDNVSMCYVLLQKIWQSWLNAIVMSFCRVSREHISLHHVHCKPYLIVNIAIGWAHDYG